MMHTCQEKTKYYNCLLLKQRFLKNYKKEWWEKLQYWYAKLKQICAILISNDDLGLAKQIVTLKLLFKIF